MRVLATIDVDDDDDEDEDGCFPILARVRLCVAVAVLAIVICLISSASAFLAASFEPAASSSLDRRHTRATSHEPYHTSAPSARRKPSGADTASVERCVYSREWGGVQRRRMCWWW